MIPFRGTWIWACWICMNWLVASWVSLLYYHSCIHALVFLCMCIDVTLSIRSYGQLCACSGITFLCGIPVCIWFDVNLVWVTTWFLFGEAEQTLRDVIYLEPCCCYFSYMRRPYSLIHVASLDERRTAVVVIVAISHCQRCLGHIVDVP